MSSPTMHDVNRFVGIVSAGCALRNWDAVRAAFVGLDDVVAAALATQVSHHLRDHASIEIWAEAARYLPTAGRREASRQLGEHLDAAIKEQQPQIARANLLREAFSLLRRGVGPGDLVERMRAVNASQSAPMDQKSLDDLTGCGKGPRNCHFSAS